jgi:hypothetical protein
MVGSHYTCRVKRYEHTLYCIIMPCFIGCQSSITDHFLALTVPSSRPLNRLAPVSPCFQLASGTPNRRPGTACRDGLRDLALAHFAQRMVHTRVETATLRTDPHTHPSHKYYIGGRPPIFFSSTHTRTHEQDSARLRTADAWHLFSG